MAQGSSAHFQLVASLQKAGLGIEDVKLNYFQPADELAVFSRGKVDAWAIWDPYSSQVLRTAVARVLTTGESVVNGLGFGTRVPVAIDAAAIASEQEIADTFAELRLSPRRFDFEDYVDTRFNRDLPASSTAPRSYGKASS